MESLKISILQGENLFRERVFLIELNPRPDENGNPPWHSHDRAAVPRLRGSAWPADAAGAVDAPARAARPCLTGKALKLRAGRVAARPQRHRCGTAGARKKASTSRALSAQLVIRHTDDPS
jgi:hypothetical protein